MFKKTFVFFGIFLLTLVICSAVIKNNTKFPLPTPTELRNQSLEYEASVFSRQRIKREARQVTIGKDLRYSINSAGYRGKEIENPKRRLRLAIYGGSSVYDPVSRESWPERLEKKLLESGFDIEVINAGIPGASSAEITARFMSEAFFIQPDVVLMYETWNDIRFFNPEAPGLRDLPSFREEINYYVNAHNKLDSFLSENFYLYLMLRYLILDLVSDGQPRAKTYGDDRAFSAEINADFKRQVALNYAAFTNMARSAGAIPILATQAMLPTEKTSSEEKMKIDFLFVKLNLGQVLRAKHLIQAEIRSVARREKTDFIDAAADISGQPLFFDHVHFHNEGSEKFSAYMTSKLIPILSRVQAKKRR